MKSAKNQMLENIRRIYLKMKEGLSLDEATKEAEETLPLPPGFPHKLRERRRVRNYRSRASRRINRLRAKL